MRLLPTPDARVLSRLALAILLAAPAVAQAEDRASFDCAKARTPREQTACATPETRKADAEMAKAFSGLLRSLSPPRAEALVTSQRTFNAYVDQSCQLGGARPRPRTARGDAEACLVEKLAERAEFLGGLSVARAGALVIEPLVTTAFRVSRPEGETRATGWVTQDAVPHLSGASHEAAAVFAAEVKRLLRTGTPLIAGRTSLVGSITRSYSVSLLDERLASLQAVERVEAGTRVSPVEVGITIDLRAGRLLRLDAVFTRSEAWRTAMTAALRQDLNHPDAFDTHIDAILEGGPDVIWAFAPDKATVSWKTINDPGESVDIPASVLAAFLKPDSPWRPAKR